MSGLNDACCQLSRVRRATDQHNFGWPGTRTKYSYDASGNTIGDSTDTNTYNDAGRLKTLTNTSGTTTFVYSALGQMIEASGPSGATLYAYDQAGHLLGEYDGAGNLIQETVWLGDIPVATIRPNGSWVATYYVVTDQLDTPREIVRPSDNALMWTWFTGPFGVETPNTNPQGAGTFTYDLRFPGQLGGAWGATLQNDHRDYDSAVGEYVEPDPIGLLGGSYATYAYVSENPLEYRDPLGTDVRVETTSAVYGFHEHISVDTPNGPYAVAFGMENRDDPEQGSSVANDVDPTPDGAGGLRGSRSGDIRSIRLTHNARTGPMDRTTASTAGWQKRTLQRADK